MSNMLLWMNVSLTRFNQGLVFTQAGRGRKVTFAVVFFRWLFNRHNIPNQRIDQGFIYPPQLFQKDKALSNLDSWSCMFERLLVEYCLLSLLPCCGRTKIEFLDDHILANQLGKKSRNLMYAWIIYCIFTFEEDLTPLTKIVSVKNIFKATEFS